MKLAWVKAIQALLFFRKMPKPGMPAKDYYKPYSDWIFEIGLTPNRMDAMSHIGVAKDVCAYLSHHNNTETKVASPFNNNFENR